MMIGCTQTRHEIIKRDRVLYEAITVFCGWQQDIEGRPFELRTCVLCQSTLSDGTRAPTPAPEQPHAA